MLKRVLIIDDEIDICFLLSSILKRQQFYPYCAHSLSEGLKLLDEAEPAILFLDINLPDGSGLDVIQPIKVKFPDITIIVISAYDNEKAHAYQKGADFFISKPFSNEIIRNSLEVTGYKVG